MTQRPTRERIEETRLYVEQQTKKPVFYRDTNVARLEDLLFEIDAFKTDNLHLQHELKLMRIPSEVLKERDRLRERVMKLEHALHRIGSDCSPSNQLIVDHALASDDEMENSSHLQNTRL